MKLPDAAQMTSQKSMISVISELYIWLRFTAQDRVSWNPRGPQDHLESESISDIRAKKQVSALKRTDVIGAPNPLKDAERCCFYDFKKNHTNRMSSDK